MPTNASAPNAAPSAPAISAISATGTGIGFVVRVESANRECFVTNEALDHLCGRKLAQAENTTAFRAFEAKIAGVARRKIHAGVAGTPLLLTPDSFH
ncbi:DUF1488 family protein [Lacisediminimonas profundi]|uniref:DUF1488 family protein n=1 Tax=Lacisediminimonas profundi TaxID=2603856 RepID=UPI00124B3277|nr:DUF1488 family protein [Lacisediminimonas profundi]